MPLSVQWIFVCIFVWLKLNLTISNDFKTYNTDLGGPTKCLIKPVTTTTATEIHEVVNCYGIPYALPPLGNKRFKHPVLMNQWQEVDDTKTEWDATKKGDGCMQNYKGTAIEFDGPQWNGAKMSENCLNLNIYRPNNDNNNLPVMVWYHGGNFRWGYGAAGIYDGSRLSVKGVMVITVNYRLDVLGTLYIGGSNDIKGNQGYMDCKTALIWIQKNIESFGGDPNSITIFGESAGAQTVMALMADKTTAGSSGSPKLFHRVISESAPLGIPFRTPKTWSNRIDSFGILAECFNIKIWVNSIKDLQGGRDVLTSKPDALVEIIAYILNPDTNKIYEYVIGITDFIPNTRQPVWKKNNEYTVTHYIKAIQFIIWDKHTSDTAHLNKGKLLGKTDKIEIISRGTDFTKNEETATIYKKSRYLGRKRDKGELTWSYQYSDQRIENCLRGKTAEIIQWSSNSIIPSISTPEKTGMYNEMEPWTPTVDGRIIKIQPYLSLSRNDVRNDVELLYGVTEDEATMFVYMILPHPVKGGSWLQTWKLWKLKREMANVCTEQFNAYMACGQSLKYCSPRLTYNCAIYALMGEAADHLRKSDLETFQCGSEIEDCRQKLVHVVESILFSNPMYIAGEKLKNNKLYLYQFDVAAVFAHSRDAQSNPIYPVLAREACVDQEASCHGCEMVFVFHSDLESLQVTDAAFNKFTDNELLIINDIQTFWSNFAKTGNPGGGWGEYHESNKKVMKFHYRMTNKATKTDEYHKSFMEMSEIADFRNCKWWDSKLTAEPWWITFGDPNDADQITL